MTGAKGAAMEVYGSVQSVLDTFDKEMESREDTERVGIFGRFCARVRARAIEYRITVTLRYNGCSFR